MTTSENVLPEAYDVGGKFSYREQDEKDRYDREKEERKNLDKKIRII